MSDEDATASQSNPFTIPPIASHRGDAFSDLSLSPFTALQQSTRQKCPLCLHNRRYFCASCLQPLLRAPHTPPQVALPVHVHILQTGCESPMKSTAQHINLLSPAHSTLWRPFPDCLAAFERQVLAGAKAGSIALLYPSEHARSPQEAAVQLAGLAQIVVIDSTWTKSVALSEHVELLKLPKITVSVESVSRYWRYAPKRSRHSKHFSPDKASACLSTVEAVHSFCKAFAKQKGVCGDDGCEVDDLLWLFAFLHGRVREVYEKAPGKRERVRRKSKGLLTL